MLELNIYALCHSGSKDEAFFDSQPWLESDCEDDFYSVNGGKNIFKFLKLSLSLIPNVFPLSFLNSSMPFLQ